VAAGGFHACGETPEKRTYCWGWNLQGAVGDETKSMRTTPVAVVGGLRFGQVSGGSTHTCARKRPTAGLILKAAVWVPVNPRIRRTRPTTRGRRPSSARS